MSQPPNETTYGAVIRVHILRDQLDVPDEAITRRTQYRVTGR